VTVDFYYFLDMDEGGNAHYGAVSFEYTFHFVLNELEIGCGNFDRNKCS
jgi:hypothetical protein